MENKDPGNGLSAGNKEIRYSFNRRRNMVALAAAILIITAAVLNKSASSPTVSQNPGNIANLSGQETANEYQVQTDYQANVSVEVTPADLSAAGERNVFEIKLNTHSVSLDYDFAKIITLKDNRGNVYQADGWTGGQGGHHITGNAIFSKMKPGVKSVKLYMDGVGGVSRTFEWKLL